MTVHPTSAPAPTRTRSGASSSTEPAELALLARVRAGDEASFAELVRRYSPTMVRLAQLTVGTRAVAEEVVQEAWIGVLNGIGRFEGRSSLKTWIFRILLNKAHTRAAREAGSVPFSALDGRDSDTDEPSVDQDRFLGPEGEWAGHWASSPLRFEDLPDERLLAGETLGCIAGALAELPPLQRAVVTMRDVEGWSSADVCGALGLSASNQRVLLHRGRSKVRSALETYLAES